MTATSNETSTIKTKRMPSKSSESNIVGDKLDTMNKEYIIILKK